MRRCGNKYKLAKKLESFVIDDRIIQCSIKMDRFLLIKDGYAVYIRLSEFKLKF